MRYEELEGLLAVWPFSLVQDFMTFSDHLELMHINAEEIREYIRHRSENEQYEAATTFSRMKKINETIREKFPRCPICGNILFIQDINNHPSRMVDDHSRSWWICPDMQCEFEPVLNDKFSREVLSDNGIFLPFRNPMPSQKLQRRMRAAAKQRNRKKG